MVAIRRFADRPCPHQLGTDVSTCACNSNDSRHVGYTAESGENLPNFEGLLRVRFLLKLLEGFLLLLHERGSFH